MLMYVIIKEQQPKPEVVVPKKIKYVIWFIIILAMQLLGVLAATVGRQLIIDIFTELSSCKHLYKLSEWFFKTPGKFKFFSHAMLALAYAVKAKLKISKASKTEEKEYNNNLEKWYGLVTTILLAASVLPYNWYAAVELIWYLHYKNMEYNKKSA